VIPVVFEDDEFCAILVAASQELERRRSSSPSTMALDRGVRMMRQAALSEVRRNSAPGNISILRRQG